jgi:integrase
MSVNLRKDGRWMVRYKVDGKTKWEYFTKGIRGEKKAKARHEQLKAQGVIGQYKKQPDTVAAPLFQVLATEYLSAKSIELSKVSGQNLLYKLKGVILPEIGDIQAMRINSERLRNYVKKRLNTPVTKRIGKIGNQKKIPVKDALGDIKMVSKTTVHRELSDIIAILNWSVAEGFLPRNPAEKFKKPTRDDEIIQPPTSAEIQMIIKYAPAHLVRALTISFYTGLRPGAAELFRMTWDDINLADENIFILSAKKGGPRSRLLPLHPEFKKQLEAWAKDDKKQLAAWAKDDKKKGAQYLITWKGMAVKSVDSSFKTAKRKAGIKRRLRLYDFRHAFATNMLKHGGDLKSTSEMLGHSRTDTTSRIYQHTDMSLHRKNINRLPGLTSLNDGAKKES